MISLRSFSPAALLLASSLVGAAGPSAEDSILQVTDGSGATHDEALRNAFQAAIQKTVGVYIDSERVLKDDVLKKRILAFSNGFIETYRELPLPPEGGRVRVRIAARVRKSAVRQGLKEARVPIKEVDGAGLFAEAITKQGRLERSRELLGKLAEGFPYGMIEAELIGKPKLLEQEGDEAVIEVTVRYQFNAERYKALAAFWMQILEAIALESGDFTRQYAPKYRRRQGALGYSVVREMYQPRLELPAAYDGKTDLVVVMREVSPQWDRASFRYYVIDRHKKNPLDPIVHKFLGINFDFVDKGGRSLFRGRQLSSNDEVVYPVSEGGSLQVKYGPGRNGTTQFRIAPMLFDSVTSTFSPSRDYVYKLGVPLEKLGMTSQINLVLGDPSGGKKTWRPVSETPLQRRE